MTDDSARRRWPLHGIRVLELGQLIAGPFAGNVLGYLGAKAIKLQPPDGGDLLRKWRVLRDGTSFQALCRV